jgi:hypothetical protein
VSNVRIRRNSDPLDKIMRSMTGLGNLRIKAGAMKGQRRERSGKFGKSNAAVLAIHEFGAPGVPKREPIRQGLIRSKKRINRIWAKRIKLIHTGTSGGRAAADAMGDEVKKAIQKGIKSRLPPPLSPATLAQPKRDKRGIPLLDTGQLHDSIDVKVESR